MAIRLTDVTEPPPPPPGPRSKRELDEPRLYWGDKLASEVRRAVARECGAWGSRRTRDSDHERDALTQSLALWALEHASTVEGLIYPERMATYRQVLRRHLIRDSRAWQDSLEDRAIYRTRPVTRDFPAAAMDAAAQAKLFRETERNRRPAPHTSDEVLIRRHRSPDGHIDWIESAGDREAETDAGEAVPAVALIAGTDELARAMAEAVIDRLEDRPNPIVLTAREREALEIALLVGESHDRRTAWKRNPETGELEGGKRVGGTARVATVLGCSRDRIQHLSAEGTRLLRTLLSPVDLAMMRRDVVARLYAVDEPTPETVREVDRALGIAPLREAIDRAVIKSQRAGRQDHTAGPPHGSARQVLAYIDRMEALVNQRAVSFRTDGAIPTPPPPPRAHTPIRDEWVGEWCSDLQSLEEAKRAKSDRRRFLTAVGGLLPAGDDCSDAVPRPTG